MLTGHPIGWIALAAFLVGLIVRTIKSDGMKVALANLGLPPIPTRALPWLALAFGAVAAFLDAKVAGATWDAAAQAGVMAAALAVFGHELGSGVPGVKKLLGVALLIIPLSTASCSLLTRENAKSALDAVQIACVFGTEVTDEKAVADACGIARDLIPIVRNLVGQREAAKRSGMRWGACIDGGVPDAGAEGGVR